MIDALLNNQYAVINQIGVGGMSEVYCAVNIKSKDRQMVTIKMLKRELFASEQAKQMFRTEAQIALSLKHKNTVRAYDFIEETDKMYIVLQYIEGWNLKDYLKQKGRLGEGEAVSIVNQVARALRYAHNNGYIHKDVKPQNILIDHKGHAFLTDFGLAGDEEFHISDNKVMGSIYYLSPEHAKGAEVSERSDIYSLGIVLYEMITGKLPFGGKDTKQVLQAQLYADALPPQVVQPAVSAAISQIVMKAIAKDPEYRYVNFNNFLADIKKAEKKPDKSFVTMQAVPVVQKQEDGVSNWKKVMIGVGVVALVFLAILAVSNFFRGGEPGGGLRMPNLIGMSQSQATSAMEKIGVGYTIVYYDDENAKNGTVLHQAPVNGTALEAGDTVEIGIVLNSQNTALPDFANMKRSDAYSYLDSLNVSRKNVEYIDSLLPYDFVIEQSPQPGTALSGVESVTLYLSNNHQEKVVPDVKNLSIEQAKQRLQQAGYGVGIVYEEEGRSEVKVYSQVPSAGEKTYDVLMVDLYVGKNPAESVSFTTTYDVSIKQDQTNVKICYQDDDGLIYLANEYKALNKGVKNLNIHFNAGSDRPKTVYIYIDNVRRIVIGNVEADR